MAVTQGCTLEHCDEYRPSFRAAADAGFEYVELNMEARFSRDAITPETVRDVATAFGLDIVVHLPYKLDIGSPHEHARTGACRELEACIDTAHRLGATTAVVHASSAARPRHWDESRVVAGIHESVQRLHEYASGEQITLCAENLTGPFVDVRDFPELFVETDAAMCLDTGHAFVSGMDGHEQAEFLRTHGDRVAHVHLNDTRTTEDDEHLPVGLGRLDFAPLAAAIRDTDWTGSCTHEVFGFDSEFAYLRAGKRRFDTLLA